MTRQKSLVCKVYSILYKWVPLTALRASIIRGHFTTCPGCRKDALDERVVQDILGKRREEEPAPDLWPQIRRQIVSLQKEAPAVPTGLLNWRWGLATASLALVVLLLVVVLPLFKGPLPMADDKRAHSNSEDLIVVKSVQVDNRPARTYFFQTQKDRLIVWVQKNNE
jgi:hypothetical protein